MSALLCSVCGFRNVSQGVLCWKCTIDQDVKQAREYPEKIQPLIPSFFEEFKASNRLWRDAKILDEKQFEILVDKLKQTLHSGFWVTQFMGWTTPPTPPIVLSTIQAESLLSIVKKGVAEKEQFRFIHALAPIILYFHSLRHQHQDFRNYTPGTTKDSIFQTWASRFKWLYNCETYAIAECAICLEPVTTQCPLAQCGYCQQVVHYKCKQTYVLQLVRDKKCLTCELCKHEYKTEKENEIYFLNGAPKYYNSETLQSLSWYESISFKS